MPATKRRRRKSKDPQIGKEAWQIVGPDGAVLREIGHGEGATLGLAQNLAQKEECPETLIVRLKPLFGEADEFYRVVREEDGSVSTYRK